MYEGEEQIKEQTEEHKTELKYSIMRKEENIDIQGMEEGQEIS